MGGLHRREIELGHDTCILGFTGREMVDSAVFDASYLVQGGVDEVQTLTIDASSGDFTLAYKDQVTADIAENATAATVETELRALSRIGTNGVSVAGSAGGPYTITFGGALAKKSVELLVADDTGLSGGTSSATVARTTAGSSIHAGLFVLVSGLVLTHGDTPDTVKPYTGEGNVNEVQTLTITGTPNGGDFTLVYDGEETAVIAYNATAAAVKTALAALSNLDAADITTSGGALPGTAVVITFSGDDSAGVAQPLITVGDNGLTGGTNPEADVAQTTSGGEDEEIVGIFDGRREFFDNTQVSNKEIPVYNFGVVFDKDKIQGFDGFEAALRRWGETRSCVFDSQGSS